MVFQSHHRRSPRRNISQHVLQRGRALSTVSDASRSVCAIKWESKSTPNHLVIARHLGFRCCGVLQPQALFPSTNSRDRAAFLHALRLFVHVDFQVVVFYFRKQCFKHRIEPSCAYSPELCILCSFEVHIVVRLCDIRKSFVQNLMLNVDVHRMPICHYLFQTIL